TAPTAAYVPANHSPRRPPAASGGFSGRPRVAVDPHAAWSVNSVAARSAHGPSHPNGVIVTTTSAGFSAQAAERSTGSTARGMSAARSSGSQPTIELIIRKPSSRVTIAGAYGTVNAGRCGRHTTVQLYSVPRPALVVHESDRLKQWPHTVPGRRAIVPQS